ncbi:MAG: hypothetical protein HKN04_03715, partial [Rhodothermaceae bacterium]|nr:hypothetical protein [Rhodothermaceae bacterium]
VYTIQVTQTQDRSQEPLFAFDVNVELNFPNAPREVRRFHLASADTTLRFRVPEKPSFVRFDEGNWLFADIALTQPVDELVAMSAADDEMAGRYDGVDALADLPENPVVRQALVAALTDIHPKVRERAAEALEDYIRAPGVAEALARRIRDPEASVRGTALDALSTTENTGLLESTLREALADSSYGVVAAAIRLYAARFPEQAYDAYEAEGLPELTSWNGVVEQALMQAIGTLRDERGGTVLLARVGPNNPDAVRAAGAAGIQVLALDHAVLREPAREAYRTYLDDRLEAVRLAVVRGLARFGEASDIARLEERLEVEESDEVKAALRMALGQIRSRQSGTQLDQ